MILKDGILRSELIPTLHGFTTREWGDLGYGKESWRSGCKLKSFAPVWIRWLTADYCGSSGVAEGNVPAISTRLTCQPGLEIRSFFLRRRERLILQHSLLSSDNYQKLPH